MEVCNLRPFQNPWDQVHDFTPGGNDGEKHWSKLQEKVTLQVPAGEVENFSSPNEQQCVPWTAGVGNGSEPHCVIACASEEAAMDVLGRLRERDCAVISTRHMCLGEEQRKLLAPLMLQSEESDPVLLLVAASASSCKSLVLPGSGGTQTEKAAVITGVTADQFLSLEANI